MYRIIQSIFNILVLCLCIQTVKTTLNLPTYSVPQDTSPRVTSKYSASRPSSLFLCSNGRKIDHSWQCDGENDCGDNSDESHCPRSWHRKLEINHKCHPNKTYSCVGQGAKCILKSKVCDHQRDCPDGDDEGDHCRTNPCYELNCAHQCEANGTVPYCTCRDGFKLNDGSNCEDVNECDSRVCSQQCRNTKGGFECSCIKGYELVNRTMCLAKDTSPILYYSIGREIRGLDIRENISHRVVYAHILHRQWTEITSIERYENLLFYVGTIKGNYTHSALIQVTLPTNRQFRHQHKLPFSDKYGRIEDIALDWIHGNLYLCTRHTIVVCRIEPFYCATIMTNLKSANSILVQPDQNRLIWSQDTREGEVGIFSTDLSGTLQRTKLIDDRNPLDQWPFDIVYDSAMRSLYWIDRNKCSIQNVELGLNAQIFAPTTESSSSYQLSYLSWNPSVRTSRRMSESTIQQSTYPHINHVLNSTNLDPIAMAVFEDWIYWTSSTKSSIFVSNKQNGNNTKMLIGKHKPGLFGSISLYHPLNYPNVSSSSFLGTCFGAQDVCSDICLLSFTQPHYECICPDHKYKINSTHCAVRSESSSVIVSFGNKMVRVYEDSDHVHPLMETHQYLIDEIAFNLDREELYAHDRLSNKIGVFALRDISKNPATLWTTLVESRLRKVVSLVYDVNTDYLYWVDRKRGTFEVTSTRGPRHRAIIHDHLEEPLSLALNAREMKWYIGLKGGSTRKNRS